ncbi:hypothetical protein M3J09_010151 [Ascochyta lentis]
MPPPKRMSDILASSSTCPPTTCPPTTSPAHAPPYSSDGPTLPLLSAHTTKLSSADKNRKRKRTVDQAPQPHPQPHRAHHPKLYEPWTLLPGKLEREVKKLGEGKGKGGVEVLVFSRNQNVKAAVNKLRVLLSSQNGGTENRDEGGNEDGSGSDGGSKTENAGIIAISAQGEGTVKLVGILELARRIIGAPSNNGAPTTRSKEEGKDEKVRNRVHWHTYTLLSSVAVPRGVKITPASPRKSSPTAPPNKVHRNKVHRNNAQSTLDDDPMQLDADDDAAGIAHIPLNDVADGDGDGDGDADVDAEIDADADGDIDGDITTTTTTTNQEPGKTKILPVLTIWMSRFPLPGFRDAGGEGEEVVLV